MKWGKPDEFGTVRSHDGRWRIENWSDDYARTWVAIAQNEPGKRLPAATLAEAKRRAEKENA